MGLGHFRKQNLTGAAKVTIESLMARTMTFFTRTKIQGWQGAQVTALFSDDSPGGHAPPIELGAISAESDIHAPVFRLSLGRVVRCNGVRGAEALNR